MVARDSSLNRRFRSLLSGIAAALLCLVLCLAATGQKSPQPSEEMERQFQQAMAEEDQGNLDQAQSLLSELNRAHPGIFAVEESRSQTAMSHMPISARRFINFIATNGRRRSSNGRCI